MENNAVRSATAEQERIAGQLERVISNEKRERENAEDLLEEFARALPPLLLCDLLFALRIKQ